MTAQLTNSARVEVTARLQHEALDAYVHLSAFIQRRDDHLTSERNALLRQLGTEKILVGGFKESRPALTVNRYRNPNDVISEWVTLVDHATR